MIELLNTLLLSFLLILSLKEHFKKRRRRSQKQVKKRIAEGFEGEKVSILLDLPIELFEEMSQEGRVEEVIIQRLRRSGQVDV